MAPRLKAMAPWRQIPRDAESMLDVGCNAGEFLSHCRRLFPGLKLAGIEINATALEEARRRIPDADLRLADASRLPFPDESFDCVSCMEVLEHIPEGRRPLVLAEMQRVVKPGGHLLLRVPHRGAFSFLDAANMRFRFPRLYRWLIGLGKRDSHYPGGSSDVVWHHHFSLEEITALAGRRWELIGVRRGACFLMPLMEYFAWPFYRLGRIDGKVFRLLQDLMRWDMDHDWGEASFDMLVVLKKR